MKADVMNRSARQNSPLKHRSTPLRAAGCGLRAAGCGLRLSSQVSSNSPASVFTLNTLKINRVEQCAE
jgi:hypothetical protein